MLLYCLAQFLLDITKSSLSYMEILQLPMNIVHDMMFSFHKHWGQPAISRTRYEPEPFFPKIIPRRFGELLLEKDDKINPLFQIFLYPDHAEIWSYEEWRLSVSRRYYVLHESPEAVARSYGTLIDNIRRCILVWSPHLNHPDFNGKLTQMAKALSKAPRHTTDMIPGLTEIIYGK